MSSINVKNVYDVLKTQNEKTFTVANCARVVASITNDTRKNVEKIARRKMRANASCDASKQKNVPNEQKSNAKNERYNFALTQKNVEMIVDVITN